MEHTYCVIMAGGKGERFWPLSTKAAPKPFIKLIGDKTMIQMTVDRLLGLVSKERIFVVLGCEHLDVARQQLPEFLAEQFIVEPVGRDTAPCIGFTATILDQADPDAIMVVLPADQYIPDTRAFVETVSLGVECARKGEHLLTIGITPTRPETGYGYIRAHEPAGITERESCFRVNRFVEKPDEAKARQYLSEGSYYWNAGIFVWRAKTVLRGIERYMPELHHALLKIRRAMECGDTEEVEAVFRSFPKISIDYGLMEKADNVLMMKANFSWDDVGSWGALRRVMELDDDGNYRRGETTCVDTENCVIYAENMRVGAVGLSNLIVVASKDGVLVCDLARDQDTRRIARMLDDGEDA